jgi:hypothetical protein
MTEDFRNMARHALGLPAQRDEIRHGCPECFPARRPFCPVCLGVGNVSNDRLSLYLAQQEREIAGMR